MLRDIEFDLYEANANDFEEQCNLPDTPIEYFEQFLSYSDAGTGIRVSECFESEKIEAGKERLGNCQIIAATADSGSVGCTRKDEIHAKKNNDILAGSFIFCSIRRMRVNWT